MPTYTLIMPAVVVGSGGAASIDFSSIPSTYTDLVLKLSLRQSSTSIGYATIKFNGSSTGFTYRSLEGSGSTASSFNGSVGAIGVIDPANYTASTFSSFDIYIPNYAGSTNKSYSADAVSENNATTAYADLIAGLWSNTAAINQITVQDLSGNLVQYSSAYLYGVSNA
jgi:hypothetical protein